MTNVNVQSNGSGDITDAVSTVAGDYETALNRLLGEASNGSMDISSATVNTTQVQQAQAVLEMTQGIAKNASDHLKSQAKKLG